MQEDYPWHAATFEICRKEIGPKDTTEKLNEPPVQMENGYKEEDGYKYVEGVLEIRSR